MDKETAAEGVTVWRPITVRKVGRPRLRWKGDVRVDLEKNEGMEVK
jgi:hypothetical protein